MAVPHLWVAQTSEYAKVVVVVVVITTQYGRTTSKVLTPGQLYSGNMHHAGICKVQLHAQIKQKAAAAAAGFLILASWYMFTGSRISSSLFSWIIIQV